MVFLTWVCALRLLHRNSVWLHGIFGALTGLAWLTDVTALIVVAAWLAASGGLWLRAMLRRHEPATDEAWSAKNHFVGLVVVALTWMAVCGSRCGAAMDHWGRPMFAWQQHWMWLDNSSEALQLADRFEEVRGLENGRRLALPGWDDYWKTHTLAQAKERLTAGSSEVWGRVTMAAGFWLAVPAGLFLTAWIIVLTRRRAVNHEALHLPRGAVASVVFVFLTCAGFGLWCAWYAPIQTDACFLMVIYLPLVWSLVWGAEKLMTLARMRGLSRRVWLGWRVLLWLASAAMAVDVALLLRETRLFFQ